MSVVRLICLLAIVLPAAAQEFSLDFREDPVRTGERYNAGSAFLDLTGQTVPFAVSVDYSYTIAGGTRTGYTALWSNSRTTTFAVYGVDDDIYSDGTTGTVTISYYHPFTGQLVTKQAGIAVEDDEREPRAQFDDARVIESEGGVHAVPFRLTHRSTFPTVVPIQTCCGDATAGTDFELLDTSVTIPPMQLEGEARFRLFPDRDAEGVETFRIFAVWGMDATVTIVEEDLSAIVTPPSPRVPAGELFELEAWLPEGAPSPLGAQLAIADRGVVDFAGPDDLLLDGTAKKIVLRAGLPGLTTLTLRPGSAVLSSTVTWIEVYDVGFDVDSFPQPLNAGDEIAVPVRMNPPGTPFELAVDVNPAGIIEASGLLTFGAGGESSLTIRALKAGTADIRLFTPSGKLVSYFDVKVEESIGIAGVVPGSGPTAGGTVVTITGGAFRGACSVKFGAVAGTAVTRVDEATLRATTPSHGHGTVDVTVTCNGESHTRPQSFTFDKPGRARSVRH